MLPTCLSRHMKRFRRSSHSVRHLSTEACVVPPESLFHTLLIDGTRSFIRGVEAEKTQHEKHCQRQVWWSSKTLKLRPFGRTSSTGPHTSGCRPFEINTFPAVLTLVADFGLICAQREKATSSMHIHKKHYILGNKKERKKRLPTSKPYTACH